ncbi:serine--tRNA ligase [Candidatus Woesearchaeota archaeon CG1_02_57_44]|nr:MAG: serine--tRNA ligase [Candidatus Woesearchaeota archaeon CG1_02_57_44]
MLDIAYVRENQDAVRKNLERRQDPEKLQLLDNALALDVEWRKMKTILDLLRQKRNQSSKSINEARKKGDDIAPLLAEAKTLPDQIRKAEEDEQQLQERLRTLMMRIPNLLHDSVPYGEDESGNVVVKTWGEPRKDAPALPHGELLVSLGLADFDKAAEVAGQGFNYLFGDMALLNLSLQRFALDKLQAKGFCPVMPPYMLRRKPYEGVTDLADFETMMYKIDGEDLHLIATSEHPIAALLMGEVLEDKALPVLYAGVSPCFRKELGSHGVDEKGIFRVHIFQKIEQFVFCRPEESWEWHEKILANAEELFRELELPYRVVNICTGDIGIVAAKKYDLEVWMPREQQYKEAVSCSNCTGYQAVRLNIKYHAKEERKHVHTLNSTAIAVQRAMRAIVENHAQPDGTIRVPQALVPYMGKDVIGKRS